MEVKQFIELYINSSDVEQINMLINMPTSGKMILIQQLIGEYRACQKKYEEKLRWIPVEEILPPKNKKVLVKYHNDNLFSTTEFESKDIIKTCNYCGITHWRFIL